MSKMTDTERKHAFSLLKLTKLGDGRAREQLATIVADEFYGRIAGYGVTDPAVTQDDLRQVFWVGIWKHLPDLDGRGDDLYHAGQRGVWAVLSFIKAVNRDYHGEGVQVCSLDANPGYEPWQATGDHDEVVEAVMALEDAERARKAVRKLRGRVSYQLDLDMLDWVLRNGGDLDEPGLNKRGAIEFGFSEQRASQVRARLRRALVA